MTIYEKISIAVSCIALAISGYVFFMNRLFATGEKHAEIRSRIDKAHKAMLEQRQTLNILKDDDSMNLYQDACRGYLNQLEDGCADYFGYLKCDRRRFREAFRHQIKAAFHEPNLIPLLTEKDYPYLHKWRSAFSCPLTGDEEHNEDRRN